MPNWCECDLAIGPFKDDVEVAAAASFLRDLGALAPSGLLDFAVVVPEPPSFRRLDASLAEARVCLEKLPMAERPRTPLPHDGFSAGGHEWRFAAWGCKWSASRTSPDDECPPFEEDGLFLRFHFSTPWGPPIPVIGTLVRWLARWRAVQSKDTEPLKATLEYFEAGMQFQGVASFEASHQHSASRSIADTTFFSVSETTKPYSGSRGG